MMISDGFEITKIKAGEYSVKDIETGTEREFRLRSHPVTKYWQIFEHDRKLKIDGDIDFYPRESAYKALRKMLTTPPKIKPDESQYWRTQQVVKIKVRGQPPPPSQIVNVRFNRVGTDRWVAYIGTRIFHMWRDEEGWWYGNEEGFKNFATRMNSRKDAELELQYWLDAER